MHSSSSNSSHHEVLFIRSECNQANDTLHGLEVMGKRLTREIIEKTRAFVAQRSSQRLQQNDSPEQVVCFRGTFIGHSLGGLILRNAFRWLLQDEQTAEELCSLGIRIEPYSFITLVSPHLGSRRPAGNRAWKLMANIKAFGASVVCNRMLGQTGLELYLEDSQQMLLEMTRGEYMSALKKFRYRTAVATSFGDLMVPHCSASFRPCNPHRPLSSYWNPSFRILTHSGFDILLEDGEEEKEERESAEYCVASIFGPEHRNDKRRNMDAESSQLPIEEKPRCLYRRLFAQYSTTSHCEEMDAGAGTGTVTYQSLALGSKSNKQSLQIDNCYEIEYHPEMLENLNSISWRRIDLEFDVPLLSRGIVHILPIALQRQLPVFNKHKIYKQAERWIYALASLVCLDLFQTGPSQDTLAQVDGMILQETVSQVLVTENTFFKHLETRWRIELSQESEDLD